MRPPGTTTIGLADTVDARGALPEEERGIAARSDATITAPGGLATPPQGAAAVAEAAPPSRQLKDLPASIVERYESIALVGRGGMGAVYRARDRRLNRVVALKFLYGGDPDASLQLLKEARSQARIDHENVCKVFEAGVADGQRYIVMQYIDGKPLDKARERMTLEEKVRTVQQVAFALHEAHRLGLVHRDVKPSNILVEQEEDGSWKPYILDFGIAREAGERGHTVSGTIAGTPAFMSPEQARGEIRSLDRRADVYSLGATLYDALIGQPPFTASTVWHLLQLVTTEEARSLRKINRDVPVDLEAIVMKCLEKEPHRRYDSAKALGEDLQRFLDGEPVHARRVSLGYVLARKAKKHKAAVALASAALLAAIILVALWVRSRRLAETQATLARELGEDVKEMELFLRSAYELPLHDVEREREVVRARLRGIEERMVAAGKAGEGPGHYALGRGHLALQEPDKALAHLRMASAAGYASPDLDYATGLSLGEMYKRAIEETKRIESPALKKARIEAIEAEYKEPALRHLRAALGARLEAPAYVEGLIALHEGKPEEALEKVLAALEKAPWLYEVRELEGDAHFAAGSRFRHDAAFDHDKMTRHYRLAAEAYRIASEIARSDPKVHEAECELWAQIMNAASTRGDRLEPSFEKAQAACKKGVEASARNESARIKLALVRNSFTWWSTTEAPGDNPEELIKETIGVAEVAAQRSPADPMAFYLVGAGFRTSAFYLIFWGLDSRSAIGRAIAAYEEAIRLDPTFLWALNELCSTHWTRLMDGVFRGIDPRASLSSAVELCDRAMRLEPSFLYPYNNKANIYMQVAEHLVATGQSPEPAVALVLEAMNAAKARSPDWPWAAALESAAYRTRAAYEIAKGADPGASLELSAQRADELGKRAPGSPDHTETRGLLDATRALHLLRQGKDPEPALRGTAELWERGMKARPWDLSFRVGRARVEILRLRWFIKEGRAGEAPFEAAFGSLLPLLDRERADPRLYQALAELHELRAAFLVKRGEDAGEDLSKGIAMADKALGINPRMAAALATKGALLLAEARAAREPETRREAARRAIEALTAAVQANPLLEVDERPALVEAGQMLGKEPRTTP